MVLLFSIPQRAFLPITLQDQMSLQIFCGKLILVPFLNQNEYEAQLFTYPEILH